jgi:hypothetical protein
MVIPCKLCGCFSRDFCFSFSFRFLLLIRASFQRCFFYTFFVWKMFHDLIQSILCLCCRKKASLFFHSSLFSRLLFLPCCCCFCCSKAVCFLFMSSFIDNNMLFILQCKNWPDRRNALWNRNKRGLCLTEWKSFEIWILRTIGQIYIKSAKWTEMF